MFGFSRITCLTSASSLYRNRIRQLVRAARWPRTIPSHSNTYFPLFTSRCQNVIVSNASQCVRVLRNVAQSQDLILLVKLRKLSDSRNMPISRWRIVSWVLGSTSGRVLPQWSSGFSSWGLSVQYDDVRSNDTEKEVSVESGPSPDASNGKLGEKSRRISIKKTQAIAVK